MAESTGQARNVPQWLGWLQARLPALTLGWIIVCSMAVIIKLCYWLPVVGVAGLLKGYSLSAAGDFLAGVAAVPALAWLVVAYYVQWRELEAASDAIREQNVLHRQQLRLAELERLQATDPRFAVRLTGVDGPLHVPQKDVISGQLPASASYRIIIRNFGNAVRDVRAEFVNVPNSLEYASASAAVSDLPEKGGFNLDLPWRRGFPCAMKLVIRYTRLDTSSGQQEFFLDADGKIDRLIPADV